MAIFALSTVYNIDDLLLQDAAAVINNAMIEQNNRELEANIYHRPFKNAIYYQR